MLSFDSEEESNNFFDMFIRMMRRYIFISITRNISRPFFKTLTFSYDLATQTKFL